MTDKKVKKELEHTYVTWFSENEMKANLGKCHMLLSSTESLNFQISETVIHNSQSRKLLGVTFDNKLKFEKHINTICQKANRKLNALAKSYTLYGTDKTTYPNECFL